VLSSKDAAFMRSLPLFKGVAPLALSAATRACAARRFPAGESLQADGERRVWLVVEGLVQLSLHAGDGRQTAIDVARPGDPFGCLGEELAPPQVFLASALTDARLIVLPRPAYLRLVNDSPPFTRRLLFVLAARLSEAQAARALMPAPARDRLVHVLLWLYDKLGPEIPMTRRALADAAPARLAALALR
jgi:CRP-like cAMP-binding protein